MQFQNGLDTKTVLIITLAILLIGSNGFMGFNNLSLSEQIKMKEEMNRELWKRDSIRTVSFDSLSAIQRSIRVQRDTLIIFKSKTDENTLKNIARIDSTDTDELIRNLSERYNKD